jgi:hypothetical protein
MMIGAELGREDTVRFPTTAIGRDLEPFNVRTDLGLDSTDGEKNIIHLGLKVNK